MTAVRSSTAAPVARSRFFSWVGLSSWSTTTRVAGPSPRSTGASSTAASSGSTASSPAAPDGGHVEVEIVGGLGGLGGFGSGGRFGGGLGLLVDAAVARLRTRGNHPGAARAVCEHLQLALPQHHARRELAAALGDAADDGVPQGGDETSQLGEGALEVAFAHVGELDAHEHGALGRVGGILHGVGRAGHGLGPRDHSTDGLWAIAQRWALAGRRGCE
jgi:hypothetical protein